MVAPTEEFSLIQQKDITDINKLSYTNSSSSITFQGVWFA